MNISESHLHLYKNNINDIRKKIFLSCLDFKVNTLYWDHSRLEHFENSLRNYPAPWIKKTLELLKIMNAKIIVEIGSTRLSLVPKCIDYFNNSYNLKSADAPHCCQDGHSTHFWTTSNLEVHTVDIDPNCKINVENQYIHHLKIPVPENLNFHIPEDGISFLENFNKKIDLLFLDGWDVGTNNYAENHLEAYEAAKDKLAPIHLISIDDTDFIPPASGKDELLSPYLIEKGYIKILSGRQTVFLNPF